MLQQGVNLHPGLWEGGKCAPQRHKIGLQASLNHFRCPVLNSRTVSVRKTIRFNFFVIIPGSPCSKGPVDEPPLCTCTTTLGFHPSLYDRMLCGFNVQRVCLSYTRDLHFPSYPRDGVFSTAQACICMGTK